MDRGVNNRNGVGWAALVSSVVCSLSRQKIPRKGRIREKAPRIAQNRREPWGVSSEGSTRLRRSWGALGAFSAMLGASRDPKLTPASERPDPSRR